MCGAGAGRPGHSLPGATGGHARVFPRCNAGVARDDRVADRDGSRSAARDDARRPPACCRRAGISTASTSGSGPTGAAAGSTAQWDSTFGGDLDRRAASASASRSAAIGGDARREPVDRARRRPDLARRGRRDPARSGTWSACRPGRSSSCPSSRTRGSAARSACWAFVGVTPFVRVGAVEELGGFAEIGRPHRAARCCADRH